VIELGRRCSRHRPVLVDFVDRGEVRPETAAALDHLDRCASCMEVVESTMLTITALRRIADDAADAEPREDSWARLRLRIEGRRARPAVMSPVAGIAMSFAIVAILILPIRLSGAGVVDPTIAATFSTETSTSVSRADRLVEAAYVGNVRRQPTADTIRSLPLNIPIEIREVRKEVHSAKPSGRPLSPI
jgi:hypothetical protein